MIKINLLAPRVPPLGAKRIPLTQGQATFVSTEDFDRFNQHSWYALLNPTTKTFYAVRNVRQPDGSRTKVSMHREILGLEPGDPRQVDHVNHDTLDNRKKNLRIVTCRENHENRRDQSPYGVGVRKIPSGRFYAQARVSGKNHYLGMHDTPQEAQKARQEFLTNRRKETPSA